MGDLRALAHYHEQNRALTLLFGDPLETFWEVIYEPKTIPENAVVLPLDGVWDNAQGEDTEQGMRNGS